MRLTPQDLLSMERDTQDVARVSRPSTILIPVFVSDVDPFTQSGYDPTLGEGTGRTVERWETYQLTLSIKFADEQMITFGSVPPGVEVGDGFFHLDQRQWPVVERAVRNEHHYMVVAGLRYRIVDASRDATGKLNEYTARIKRYTPLATAPGY